MPKNYTLKHLQDMLKKDFNGATESLESFSQVKQVLLQKIQNCGRPLEDQKTETAAALEETRNQKIADTYFNGIALLISFASTVVALRLKVFAIVYCVILLTLSVVLFAIAQHLLRNIKNRAAYYALKLECIEEMQKQQDTDTLVTSDGCTENSASYANTEGMAELV